MMLSSHVMVALSAYRRRSDVVRSYVRGRADLSSLDQPADRVTYADIFGVREFRALFASRVLSTVGDYLARAALVITVFTETGSTALMGITFALGTLPDLIGGRCWPGWPTAIPAGPS